MLLTGFMKMIVNVIMKPSHYQNTSYIQNTLLPTKKEEPADRHREHIQPEERSASARARRWRPNIQRWEQLLEQRHRSEEDKQEVTAAYRESGSEPRKSHQIFPNKLNETNIFSFVFRVKYNPGMLLTGLLLTPQDSHCADPWGHERTVSLPTC